MACQTPSIVLAMIVVAPIAIASVTVTIRDGPGDLTSVLKA
jgi:hypothetical protein